MCINIEGDDDLPHRDINCTHINTHSSIRTTCAVWTTVERFSLLFHETQIVHFMNIKMHLACRLKYMGV